MELILSFLLLEIEEEEKGERERERVEGKGVRGPHTQQGSAAEVR
jgi:hypothetical protein